MENVHCRQKEASMREQLIQPMFGVTVLTGQTQGHKGRMTSQRGGRKREEPEQQGTAHPDPEEKTPERSRNQNGPLTIPLCSSQIASFQKFTEPKQSMKMFTNIAVRRLSGTLDSWPRAVTYSPPEMQPVRSLGLRKCQPIIQSKHYPALNQLKAKPSASV